MIACVYISIHGHTRTVAATLRMPLYNLSDCYPNLDQYTRLIILCPTYGDEELPLQMEEFIDNATGQKEFAVCELGNYYGFEDYTFGAASIIRQQLQERGWTEFAAPLSLDSMPMIDWDCWERWKNTVLLL